MHSDERVVKNIHRKVLTFWVFEFCYCCRVKSVFWGRPLCWEVNKHQRSQWKSVNKRYFCVTGKVSTVLPSFSLHLNEKIVKVKGKQAKVGFLASTWANFDGFLSSCNFEAFKSKNSQKFVKMFKTRKKFVKYELVRQAELEFDVVFRVNSSVSFNHEKFSISFQFGEFFRLLNLEQYKLTRNSTILVNLTSFFFDFWT